MAKTNSAYDFDLFEKQSKVQSTVCQPPELKVVSSRVVQDNYFWARTAVIFCCALVMVSAVIYNNMILTELTTEMEAVSDEYKQLEDDHKRMQVALEGKVSMRSIEEAATTDLGMSKVENYQVEYVDLGSTSQVLLTREATPTGTDYVEKIYESVLEYLGD